MGGFPDSSVGKESTYNAGDPSLIPGSGRSSREGIGYPLQYSGLENSIDCIVSPWGHKELDMAERLSLFTLVIFGMLERPPSMTTWPDAEHRSFGSMSSVPGYRPSRAVFMCAETNFMTEIPDSMSGIPASRLVWPCSVFGH